MYFKITNREENHYGFQYVDGLNILLDDFNDDPNKSCCAGGLYFSDAANIFKFLNYRVYLREITLPTTNPNFRMVKDEQDKWRANMIILGKRHELSNVNTFRLLIEKGADIHAGSDYAFRWSVVYGYLDIVKYLLENGANIHADNDYALKWSARQGNLDLIKYLLENGANIHADYEYILMCSAGNGCLDAVISLWENITAAKKLIK